MNSFSLPTVMMISGLISFLICFFYLALWKASHSEETSTTYVFMAISYGCYALRLICQFLQNYGVTFVSPANEILYIGWICALWLGVCAYGRPKRIRLVFWVVPAMLIIWNLVARGIGNPDLWRSTPQHFTGAALFGLAGLHLWRLSRERENWGLIVLAVLLWLHGLSTVSYPFLYDTRYTPYGFTIFALLSPAVGMGLMLTVLIEEQQKLQREMRSREQAEAALAAREREFRSLAENSPDNIIRYDRQCRTIYCNPMMTQTLAIDPEMVIGKTPMDLGAGGPKGAAEYEEHLRRVLASGESSDLKIVLPHPGGGFRNHLVRIVAERDAEGSIAGVLAIGRDITEHKRMEDALIFVAQRGWMAGAENFFDALAQFLSQNLDMDYVIIATIDENPDIAETIALYAKDAIVPNMRYTLKGTPCANVIGQRLCVYPQGVQQLFPEDTLLAEMGVESYIGIPLWDSSGLPIGLITLMGSKPLPDDEPATQVLQLVATRAAAELERERSDRMLRTREHQFRTLAESLPDNIIRYDRQGRTVYLNPVLAKTLPDAAANMIGTRVREHHPDGSYEAYAQAVDDALSSGENGEIEFILPVPSKEPIVHQIRLIVEREEHGEVAGVLAIGRDITKHKQADASISKLSQAIEQSPVAIIITDIAGKIEFVNTKFSQVTGYAYAEVLGQTPRILKSGETTAEAYRQLWKTISSGGVWRGEFHNRKKNGELFWEQATIAPVRNADNVITHYLAVKEDITERKELEEQLRQAQKIEAVGQLAGGVAHDFNNMLSVIIGYAELALVKTDLDDSLRKSLQGILTAGLRSSEITRQLLAFARKQTIAPKILDLNETVEEMLKLLRRLIGEDIDLAWLPGAKLWPVKIDPSQIDQILANLCVNARDAIAGVGKVTIETHSVTIDTAFCTEHPELVPGEYVLLSVSDDGCGMNKKTRAKLFEPFFTTKELGNGTGLGLATVYGIVKQNNAFINVSSKPGQGATFDIYLPRHMAKDEDVREKRSLAQVVGGEETILLVEDEPSILEMTKLMLEGLGYQVIATTKPHEAIHLSREYPIDIHLLLTDVILPEMNGRELGERLISFCPDLKILFMSGYTGDIITRQGVLAEGTNFIEKPFSGMALANKVRDVLDSYSSG